ncbi:tetratricopeptide repeat protein [Sphingomonas sp.]|uniref:tetratricopeptide repeat protein n=1 Tax=Sphingomonas sp. TaxID=28214 RepID=UPI001B14D281|nr:tetratricopeptide repeat protein [Sphingomonas sp.]MBO9711803.1 tetratricopeptide repeat protein [Sphingomonas sp.]
MWIAGMALVAAVAPVQDADAARSERVSAAVAKISGGDLDGAFADFNALIGEYERKYAPEKRALFCAINDGDEARYEVAASRRKQPALVIDSGYCFALWGKGYVLADRKDFPGAATFLQRATTMAPDYEQFLAELGYVQQSRNQWEASVGTYARAASAAELQTDPDKRKRGQLRAWWGQGYSLIELGRIEEAKAMFRKCLELDPTYEKAQNELDYIAGLKGDGGKVKQQ